ncbi:MAG TPA: AmpG family muropeptide MFS transporter [Burkholderiales bacterium]|nr:AmpG family muropeptide MFS transporter [Burkholderiales bacterium]
MPEPAARRSWLSDLRVYAEPRVARMLLLGFSAGLPLLLVLGTLSYRLREAGIDRTTIGFLSWIGLAYGFKWVWAPLVDRLPLPLLTRALGRRRSWLLASQVVIALGLVGMALSDPTTHLHRLVGFAVLVAFASATQDIALDAFRIESAAPSLQAALAAAYQVGYRAAMITASAGALSIAAAFDPDEESYQHLPWLIAYLCMSACVSVGITTVLFSREPVVAISPQTVQRERAMAERLHARRLPPRLAAMLSWFYSAVIGPFVDFVLRYRWNAVLLLALIGTYRISDIVLGVMSNPFYRDMGFAKDEVAVVSGVYGVLMTLAGAALGGVLALRLGVMRVLFLGAALSALTNLLFAWLSTRGHDLPGLLMVICADNLSAGIASAAFVAYLSGLTNVAYSATQYALFSSVMLLLPKFLAGWSGWVVDHYGYAVFFSGSAALGVPVLALVWLARRAHPAAPQAGPESSKR